MMTKNKIAIILILFLSLNSFAQTEDFRFKRKVENVTETWHKIIVPNESLIDFYNSDIRIIGKNETGNPVEVPYILKNRPTRYQTEEVQFKIINVSSRNSEYFYTIELNDNKKINQIHLDFEQENFDWRIDLEGSNDQGEWFSILEDYRILSIKNEQTDYKFTQVDFPASNYVFYRLKIKATEKPSLKKAIIVDQKKNEGDFRISSIENTKHSSDKKQKLSIIEVELKHAVPVSSLKIDIENTFDYYRPIKIEALKDSVKTEIGWHHNYTTEFQGTLSSLSKKEFSLENTITKKLKITVQNQDNHPLEISEIEVKNAVFSLLARFSEKADYYLYYGKRKAIKPSYDIENFQKNIPENPAIATLSKEEINPEFKVETPSPLFENKLWLWVLMGIIIVALGFYSFKMLRE